MCIQAMPAANRRGSGILPRFGSRPRFSRGKLPLPRGVRDDAEPRSRPLPPLLAAALLVASCAAGPDYRPPEIEIGQGWSDASGADAAAADLDRWWTRFGDPELARLVEQALEGNLDLRQATARVAEARALRAVAAGGRYPGVDAGASVTRRRQSENGPIPIGSIPGLERDQTLYEPGFDAAWELDLFGRTRRAVEAADARVDAAIEVRRGARLSVAAETARACLALRGAQQVLEARREAVAASRHAVELVRRRYAAGDVPEAAVAQAEAELAVVEATLPLIETDVRTAALSIGVLLGDVPEAELGLAGERTGFAVLAPFPVGERGELLTRRPDVRVAERRLAAATADTGVATAALFPRVAVGAHGGFQSLQADTLFDTASETWAVAPLISWRVFDGGRVRAEIRAAEARVEQAALEYEQAVKQALADAEQALVRYELGLDALDRQQAAVDAARRNYDYAKARYEAGDIALLALLDAERTLRTAEEAFARTHTRAATDLVALFKALGGGWQHESPVAARAGTH